MNRETVYRRVVEIAGRFGPDNPQELRFLALQLKKWDPAEVLAGLFLVFSRSEVSESNYQQQEFAGRLLQKVKPEVVIDLQSTLRAVLPAYNLSIEQVPNYLADRCGAEAVIEELLLFESETHDLKVKAAARTMRWWLGGTKAK